MIAASMNFCGRRDECFRGKIWTEGDAIRMDCSVSLHANANVDVDVDVDVDVGADVNGDADDPDNRASPCANHSPLLSCSLSLDIRAAPAPARPSFGSSRRAAIPLG